MTVRDERVRTAMAEIRASITRARETNDVAACCEAMERFFDFFETHTHTWDEASDDPYNPFRNTRETDGPAG